MSRIRQRYHETLAGYFSGKPLYLDKTSKDDSLNMRKIVELPWQLSEAGMYGKLIDMLTNLDFFLGLSKINRYELWRYWETIPKEKRDMVPSYKLAIAEWEKELGKSKRFELAINELGHFFVVSGEKDESGNLARIAYELALHLYPENDLIIAIRRNNLATAYYHAKKYSEAESLLKKALPVYLNNFKKSCEDSWIIQINLVTCNIRLGKVEKAEKIIRDTIEGTRFHLGPLHLVTLTALNNLAEILWYNGKFQEARETYEEAFAGRTAILGINHPLTNETRINLNFLIAAFINKPPETAMKNLLILLQNKGLNEHAENMKKLQDIL
ncbi:MAG: tetratricopeptide repeat protein [Bacteroidetes bacterium]|nr:tetratricopeptide repeat protein [Bacteroidota bacterium]